MAVLHVLYEGVRLLGITVLPIMPTVGKKILASLDFETDRKGYFSVDENKVKYTNKLCI